MALYFAVILGWWAVSTTAAFGSREFAVGFAIAAGLCSIVMVLVFVLAHLVCSTTWYAITDKRVVMRIGMVFTMSINIPFAILSSVDIGSFKDGTGQLLLTLVPGQRIAYIALWPHCRVFSINHPQPVLRGLVTPGPVAEILASAVNQYATVNAENVTSAPAAREAGVDALMLIQPVRT